MRPLVRGGELTTLSENTQGGLEMKETEKANMNCLTTFSCDHLKPKRKKNAPQIIVSRSFAGIYPLTEALFSIAKSKIEAVSAEQ